MARAAAELVGAFAAQFGARRDVMHFDLLSVNAQEHVEPGFTVPGHRTMNGTRCPPSQASALYPRSGPLWQQLL